MRNIIRVTLFIVAIGIAALPVGAMINDPPTAQQPAAAASPAKESQDVVAAETTEQLVYSVDRTPERTFDTGRAVEVVTIDEVWRRNSRSLPEVLMEETGIFVQQTNYGAGSPIIRGLMGKQILILVDGVRVNNATWRFGPIQYLATIDLQAVDRIEIVRGVGSVLGSDSLGGVINIIMRKGPAAGEASHSSRVFGRYSTADDAWISRADVSGKNAAMRYSIGATMDGASDVRAGEIGLQRATGGFRERAANLAVEYALPDERFVSVAYNGFQQNDVTRTDRVMSGNNLMFNFDPQRFQLASVRFEDPSVTRREGLDRLQVTAYWNRQDEGNQEIRSSNPNSKLFLSDSQTTLGANVEMVSTVGRASRLVYGLDYSAEEIRSTRRDLNLKTNAWKNARGKLTDGATYDTLALYAQGQTQFGDRLTGTAGVRYARFKAGGSENTTLGHLTLDSKVSDVTGSLGLIVHVTPSVNIVANATRGFRAPSIEDLSVYADRGYGMEVPNPTVGPETIVMYEVGIKHAMAHGSMSAFLYQSNLSELLVPEYGTFNGLPFFDVNDNGVRDQSEPLVVQKQNLGRARVRGAELEWRYRPWASWTWFGNVTKTIGDDLRANEPLLRIPPMFGTMGMRWSPAVSRQPWVEAVAVAAGAQRRLNSADKTDVRIGPGGTDGFSVLNLRGGLSVTQHLRLSLAWENVFDQRYKYHGSGVYRPGSQAVVGAEIRF